MGMTEWIADGIIELAGALTEGLGDYTTDDFEKLTGHQANPTKPLPETSLRCSERTAQS